MVQYHNPFANQVGFSDYDKLNQEFEARKRAQMMQEQVSAAQVQKLQKEIETGVSSNDPAALRMANEYLAAKKAGDTDRANAIESFAKTREKNVMLMPDGSYVPLGGMPEALGQLKYGENLGGETATQQVRSAYEPQRAEDVARREANVELETEPLIKAEIADVSKMREAAYDLPKLESEASYMTDLLDQLKTHKALKSRTGLSSVIPAIPGTKGKAFDVLLDQVRGKQFMEAYQTLKGGGQITEIEGQKATEAMARMNKAQSEDDFVAAVTDFQNVVNTGLQRARMQAQDPLQASQDAIERRNSERPDLVNPNQTMPIDEPKKGNVVDGYMFMGGDPSQQKNWKKVK